MRRPVVISLISLSVSLLGAAVALRVVYGPRPLVKIASTKKVLFQILRERAREVGHALEGPDLVRIPLEPGLAAAFFPAITESDIYEYDPLAYSRPVPDPAPAFTRFPEHPSGGFQLHVNALGLREDREVARDARDLRVIVAGDSHTYGLCATVECFSRVLEQLVAAELPERHVEVLNGGVGHYNFYNYLGTFERLSWLAPDVFVLVAYGGNDFSGSMLLQRYFHARAPPAMGPYRSRTDHLPRGATEQELSQVVYFLNNPGDEALAVQTAVAVVREIQRQGHERGVELLVAYLPSAMRGQPELYSETTRRCEQALGLEREALAVGDRLADRWLAALREAGIRVLDLRPAFRASAEPLFWNSDLHLNVAGHRFVAQQLVGEVAALLAAVPRTRAEVHDPGGPGAMVSGQ